MNELRGSSEKSRWRIHSKSTEEQPFEDWGSSTKWSQRICIDLRGEDQEEKHIILKSLLYGFDSETDS